MTEAKPSADHLRLDVAGLNAFLLGAFPDSVAEFMPRVVEVRPGFVRVEQTSNKWQLRPGGLISGPTQMGLVDSVGYMLVAAHLGPVEMAVTSALNISFLRPCLPGQLSAEATLLRLGKRLVTMDARVFGGDGKLCAHGVVTYAVP